MSKTPEIAAPLSGRRKAAIWTLIVLASLLGVLSIMAGWINRQLLDNDEWNRASARIVRDPTVRETLSIYLVNSLYDNVDVAKALGQRLPPNVKPLAGPAAGALRQPATDSVRFLLARPRAEQVFVDASSDAHQRLINVLENKTGAGISTGNGVVTLNLGELVTQLGGDLGLPDTALAKIHSGAGRVTLMRSNELGLAQKGVQAIRFLSVWLLVLVLALFALAVYLARGHRRETLRTIGWAFVFVGFLVLAARRVAGNYVTDSLAGPQFQDAAEHVWLTMSSILGQIGRETVLFGVVGLLGVGLMGPGATATSIRRRLAPVLNTRPGLTWGVFAFGFLLLVLWGGLLVLRTWWETLILLALLAAGLEALRRQTLREFPDAKLGTGPPPHERLADWARTRRESRERVAAQTALTSTAPPPSVAQELAQLAKLRDAGVLSEEEFERSKQIALA
ncbi:MAG TPA: SHOCT domain-containing protein [Gaiellaceae bacterium]|nr:SHOCT domain-containing protein [Gaiellaceae bacterium]